MLEFSRPDRGSEEVVLGLLPAEDDVRLDVPDLGAVGGLLHFGADVRGLSGVVVDGVEVRVGEEGLAVRTAETDTLDLRMERSGEVG